MTRAAPAARGFQAETIEARIREYESFGIHRTGWEGDDRTSAWLRDTLRAAGVEAELERFAFPRVEVRRARLTWSDRTVDGVPLHDGGFTDQGGLEGELCDADADDVFGKIAIAASAFNGDRTWTGPEAHERYVALAGRGAIGLVIPTGDVDGAIVLRNAEQINRPTTLPVLQVALRDARALASALFVGGEGTLEVDGERLRSRATNVVAALPGSDADARPVGVMTPKSGWFTCAAERGGGIAIWIALAEALAAMQDRRRPVLFVASSGHELHHYGLLDYFKRRPDAASGAVAWLHLGASIGARHPAARMGASDEPLHAIATEALAHAGVSGFEAMPPGAPGGGEAREVHTRGGRFVSFLGGHRYFHSPSDTVDRAVDAERVAGWAAAAHEIISGMLALPE
ncbi:MAG: Zn-dependent exopeptidase M28 [Chloroflexi bacterium]|nr:Zn-dependent exopeptidase M28 [Chloroflexota bacterium]